MADPLDKIIVYQGITSRLHFDNMGSYSDVYVSSGYVNCMHYCDPAGEQLPKPDGKDRRP